MKRRKFIKTINAGVVGLATGSFALNSCGTKVQQQNQLQKVWVWMRPFEEYSADDYKELFAKMSKAGVDAILPEVYNSWSARYNSERHPVESSWLETILPLAKAAGLEVHAWMWSMPNNQKDLHEKHPNWFAVNGNGESALTDPAYVDYYKFMCPNRPGVKEFVADNVRDLAKIEDLDGVHLDYIRYPDVILPVKLQPNYNIVQDKEYPEYDYCYCDDCVSKFKNESGINIRDIKDPSQSAEWREFRYRSIIDLVNNHLVPAAKEYKKFISAAVFPNWQNVYQNWHKWNLDAFLPMLYSEFYGESHEWVGKHTAKGVDEINPGATVHSGLFAPSYDENKLSETIKTCIANGASGIALFDAGSVKSEHLSTILKFKNEMMNSK